MKKNTTFTLKLQKKGLMKYHFVQKFSKECICLPLLYLEYFTIRDNKEDGGNNIKFEPTTAYPAQRTIEGEF